MRPEKNDIKKIELVSPAGSMDHLIAAINAGADAVYLGYKKFSARAYADNFEYGPLKKAVKTAHENKVKVYLALNTLIKDSEIEEVLYFLDEYLNICQDGIIIQDFGLFKAADDLFTGIRLHASTQMSIHNRRSAVFLQNLGFKRIILAREMTLDEIGRVTEGSDIEFEAFSHGSQCYAFSGSCYFSSFTGSRSGNRGRCTQPCRMKYDIAVLDQKTRLYLMKDSYLLSKSDLCTLDIIPEITRSGIDALKIEGRMKTAEYVGIVTKIYRKYIDLYYKEPMHYSVEKDDIYKLKQIFSRELGTGYYMSSSPSDIISPKKSGSIGNFLGRVLDYADKVIYIKSRLQLNKGDYIEIWTNRGNEQLKIGNIEISSKGKENIVYVIRTERKIRLNPGDRVFKFFDESLDREAKELYVNGIRVNKKESDNEFGFKSEDYSDLRIGSSKIKKYISESLSPHKKQLKEITGDDDIPGSGSKLALMVEVYDLEDAKLVLDMGVKNIVINDVARIFYDYSKNIRQLNDLKKEGKKNSSDIIIKTPHILYDTELELFKNGIASLIDDGIDSFSVSNTGLLESIINRKDVKDIPVNIYINYMINIFNRLAVAFFDSLVDADSNIDIKDVMPSAELTLDEIRALALFIEKLNTGKVKKINFTVYSYGYFPVMQARCSTEYFYRNPDKNEVHKKHYLVDQKGYEFKIVEDFNRNLIFLNSKKICNLFDLPAFYDIGVTNLYLDTRTFNKSNTKSIIEFYRDATRSLSQGRFDEFDKITRSASENDLFSSYTKGHFFREVI